MKYEVPIVYRGQLNFIVEAASPEEAAELARSRWEEGEPPDQLGNEWEEVERVGEVAELTE